MSQREQKLLDTPGRFLQAVKDGRRREDVGWITGRILLSNRRVVLASDAGTRTIPLDSISNIGGRFDHNQAIARVAEYTAIRFGDREEQVILLTASKDPEEIEAQLYSAVLNHARILARHPAVEGGVITDAEWVEATIKVDDEVVDVALTDGTFTEIELDDISEFSTTEQTVLEEQRDVLKVAHTTEEGTSVQTHLSGSQRHCAFLESLFREGEERSEIGVELEYPEQKVLMALHSGVSPFDIPEFVGMDIEQVEEIYDRLIELDVLSEVRKRREVELTARGRKIASGAIESE